MKGGELRVISEGHRYATVGRIDDPESRPSEVVSADRSPELEHNDKVRLNPERSCTSLKVYRQIAGALTKPAAVTNKIIMPAREGPRSSGSTFARIDRLPQSKEAEPAARASL